ncbi:MAG: General transcription factor IIH subunit 3 [Phylliscum demangeonii]|nr:MAG: General transcription factor IIH subunit 3 [Phylliscum demangeonii]
MNAVDGSEHYELYSDEPPPSLLTIVLDTNPRAWAALSPTLSLAQAAASLLVFVNAHLAFNYANQVAVIASHGTGAHWLYPSPAASPSSSSSTAGAHARDQDVDVEMSERDAARGDDAAAAAKSDANKYRPFRLVEESVMSRLATLIRSTAAADVAHTNATMMAGALTLALAFINKQTLIYAETNGVGRAGSGGRGSGAANGPSSSDAVPDADEAGGSLQGLQSRILVVSVSEDSAGQYIPVMNCIFAAQRKRIPIDVLKLASTTTFLQQAADGTRGIYMALDAPRGLLQYLMMAFLPDQVARRHLVLPTQVQVDFRAACFCHKKVVDIGFVCSICLSKEAKVLVLDDDGHPALTPSHTVFCEPPPGAECLTCGTLLALADYGAKPAVAMRRRRTTTTNDNAHANANANATTANNHADAVTATRKKRKRAPTAEGNPPLPSHAP